MAETHGGYFLPHGTHWPILGSIGLTTLVVGFATLLNGADIGHWLMVLGAAIVIVMMVGWFGRVIHESEAHLYNDQVDRSFRWGMGWFIFSEVMFFAAFFGALYIARIYTVPWLGGSGMGGVETHALLWPSYEATWPTNGPGDIGGHFTAMETWGIPALNTLILLSSGVTVTVAHWGLKRGSRVQFLAFLFATIALGLLFLGFQAHEFITAYTKLGLTLGSGIYGSTFFMLTGFHGAHVTIGAVMLSVMLGRGLVGHFTADHHFAFEAAAWYWHFVDVVWLGLFTFVYWL
jgi:cytochrome c oxidase subunit 3